MEQNSFKVLHNLISSFNINSEQLLSFTHKWQGICPIGIEVEIKWKYFFPSLYDKYLKNTPYNLLPKETQNALTLECNELEKDLIPLLKLTEQCGIEKGQDRYYEFAFPPTKNIFLIYDQVSILQQYKLIPKGIYSIHFTLGELTNTKDTYYLLLILEALMCNKERIKEGFHKENKKISATWAKKGMGGIFLKESHELKHNYKNAIELRTLVLDTKNNNDLNINHLKLISFISDIIYCKQNNIDNHKENIKIWDELISKIDTVLINHNLSTNNWKKPNLNAEEWNIYILINTLLLKRK